MTEEIYVIDTETTGLYGHPHDFIVEIAICKIIDNKKIIEVYNSIVGHDVKHWTYTLRESWIFTNSDLTLNQVRKAKNQNLISEEVRDLLHKKIVTSFNVDFDFKRFLLKSPWKLAEVVSEIYPCIMLASTNLCEIPGYYGDYKWPSLYEAYRILCNGKIPVSHKAIDDTRMACEILIEILRT